MLQKWLQRKWVRVLDAQPCIKKTKKQKKNNNKKHNNNKTNKEINESGNFLLLKTKLEFLNFIEFLIHYPLFSKISG